jgi:predicted nucleic acid-binding protein
MNKYLLDTNTISYLYDSASEFHVKTIQRLKSLSSTAEVFFSILTLFELEYGVARTTTLEIASKFQKTKEVIKKHYSIITLLENQVEIFANLKQKYQKKIGISKKSLDKHNVDLMIASTAIAENAILVSNDKIFKEVKNIHPDFLLEDWTL